MKVGILTFHNAPSYGAFFQAYALSTFLRESGYSVEVVDYMPFHRRRPFGRRWSWERGGFNRSNVRWLEQLPRIGYNLRRRYVFARAVQSYLPLTNTRYASLEQLQEAPPKLDACVFGSDQIWNPAKTGGAFDAAYFGEFGPKEWRRVAYAASFGTPDVADEENRLPQLLGRLDAVSVRECSAIAVVEAYSRKKASHVLDPTFLILPEKYPEAPRSVVPGQYVLGYFLRPSDVTRRIVRHTATRLGLPVRCLPPSPEQLSGLFYTGPLRMLELLRNARYVVTDSFHGLALAINHRIDFTSVGLTGRDRCLNARMCELLDSLALNDRYLDPSGLTDLSTLPAESVEWTRVAATLEPLREESRRFLLTALGNG